MARALGPDLVTLDVMMPDINGFDVAAALRHDPATLRIPIIVISVVHDEGRGARRSASTATSPSRSTATSSSARSRALLAQGDRRRARGGRGRRPPRCSTRCAGSSPTQGWVVTPASDLAYGRRRGPRPSVPDLVIARADPADPSRLVDSLRTDPVTQHVVVVLFE